MWSRRLLLLVILSVSVDLGATVLPAAHGVVWDDEEEAVHARRVSPSPRLVQDKSPATAAVQRVAAAVRGHAGARGPDRRSDRSEPRRDLDAAQRDPAPPGEDH